jgi:peroxiredoxin
MRYLLAAVVGIVIVAIVFAAYGATGMRAGAFGPTALAGAPAQSFEVTRIDGASDALDRYRGHVVLMNLWASWCTPCREEMPDLERLFVAERGHGLVVLGIDQGESRDAAAGFARTHSVTFPILLDQDQRYGRAYAAVGLPTTIIVDPDGRIAKGVDGALTLADMREAVDPLLRRTPPAGH